MKANNKILSFEKMKPQIRYPDFLNIQISSFKTFLSYNYKTKTHKKDGLTKLFNEFFPIKPYKTFYMVFKGYYLSKPLHSPEYCLERGLTYRVQLIVKVQIVLKIRRGSGIQDNKRKSTEKKYPGGLRSPKIDSPISVITFKKHIRNKSVLIGLKESSNSKRLNKSKIKRMNEKIFLCYLPYMTPKGSFIINGYERIIVSKLIKTSGFRFGELSIKKGYKYYYGEIIPDKGILIEFTSDNSNLLHVILAGKNKFYLTTFLRAIGYSSDEDILNLFKLAKMLRIDKIERRDILGKRLAGKVLSFWFEDFVDEISGEVVTVERSSIILDRNRRLNEERINQLKANQIRQIIITPKGSYKSEYSIIYNTLRRDKTNSQEEALIYIYQKMTKNKKEKKANSKTKYKRKYASNSKQPRNIYDILISIQKISLSKRCRIKLNKLLKYPKKILTLTYEDILAIIENLIAYSNSKKESEELEHLANKSVNTIEEQLKEQLALGFSKILADCQPKIRRKRHQIKTIMKYCHPKQIIKAKYFKKLLKVYFTTNPLSQLIDQTNPLSELTQKRRLSYLGPGGLSRERAGYEMRDINYSYYGKLCPIETPEGPNIGLISSFCVFAEVNSLGYLISPYLRLKQGNITKLLLYLSSEDEIGRNICQLYQNKCFYSSKQKNCRTNSDYQMIANEKIDFMEVAYNQMASISVSLIPFLEHDDANRALMGSNMMRQAVPLVTPDLPIVYTGMEQDMIKSTRTLIYSKTKGIVKSVKSKKVILEKTTNQTWIRNHLTIYRFPIFKRTNKKTGITLKPIVKLGEKINQGQVLSEGFATKQGELALGKNIRVAFMPFKGYNFEDAIVVSEKIIKQDNFSSIKVIILTIEARKTQRSKDKLTRKLPNISKQEKTHLDKNGIVKLGTFINPGQIIVGKISQVSDSEIRPEKQLLRAILGKTKLNLKDISVRAGPSIKGIVIRRSIFRPAKTNKKPIFLNQAESLKPKKIYLINSLSKRYNLLKISIKTKRPIKTQMLDSLFKQEKRRLSALYKSIKEREINNQLPTGIYQIITISIAEKRNLKVGDKMSGRHGNKGVVAKIVKEEDMPFLEDGTIIDMVLNPLGVPSRMNLGQIYETITGEIGYNLKIRVKTPSFHGGTMKELFQYGKTAKIAPLGKTSLYNGETGVKFRDKTTVGILYMLKLGHMVDDKMHARSIGPYSLITQQPLGGKSQYGGQRFGEMEVWALEAFGASNILQELLTIKSDAIKGRIQTYESIVKGLKLPDPSMPESLRVLKNELKGLCLNLKLSE